MIDDTTTARSSVGALGMTFEYDSERRLPRAYQSNAPTNFSNYAYDAQNILASRAFAGMTARAELA